MSSYAQCRAGAHGMHLNFASAGLSQFVGKVRSSPRAQLRHPAYCRRDLIH